MSRIKIKISKTFQLEFIYDDLNKENSNTKFLFKFNPKNPNWLYYNVNGKLLKKIVDSLKLIHESNGIIKDEI